MIFNFTKARLRPLACLALLVPLLGRAQTNDTTLTSATLDAVVEYALVHQPQVKQALIDQEITEKMIRGRLADWYPQLNFTYNYQYFTNLQAAVIGGNVIRFGVNNTSSAQFNATQNIFNRDVVLATSTADQVREQAILNTTRTKVDLVVAVSKAFYDLLATTQQILVSEESVERLEKSLRDAYSRYTTGIADKTDYKRATILLSNAKAALKANRELLEYKTSNLKTVMGYPQDLELKVEFNELEMQEQIALDTLQQVNFAGHIDYQVMQNQKNLQDANVRYNRWAFIPSVSLFGNYNLNYQNDRFSELYNTNYPFSFVGATLALPIFQGGKRLARIQEASLGSRRIDIGLQGLQNNIRTEYTRALASYRSNLADYEAQRENVVLAEEVYNIINLQYQSGVKTYLEVTIAESDLRTSRINYYNTLYQVLASKMDVLRALGQINY